MRRSDADACAVLAVMCWNGLMNVSAVQMDTQSCKQSWESGGEQENEIKQNILVEQKNVSEVQLRMVLYLLCFSCHNKRYAEKHRSTVS